MLNVTSAKGSSLLVWSMDVGCPMTETQEGQRPDPKKPNLRILARVGSIAVHMEEILSNPATAATLSQFDAAAIWSLLQDSEVQAWLKQMNALGLVTVKR